MYYPLLLPRVHAGFSDLDGWAVGWVRAGRRETVQGRKKYHNY